MLRGLEGRRILVAVVPQDGSAQGKADAVRSALEKAGATVELRSADAGEDAEWRGGMYAGLVTVGGDDDGGDVNARLVQVLREFLASEKPVAAIGATAPIIEAGGAAGRTLATGARQQAAVEAAGGKWVDAAVHSDGCLISARAETDAAAFATQVVREFAEALDERDVDTMSEQSFPASDPPSSTPGSVGHLSPDRDTGAQP